MVLRDPVHGHEPDVVAVACVFRARIAKADDQFHGLDLPVAFARSIQSEKAPPSK